jgi:uncharacterized protein (DUF1330 family)
MSVMMIAFTTVNPAEPEALQAYIDGTTPLIAAAGGKLISRYQHQKAIAGSPGAQFVSIMAYPAAEAIEKLFASEAYKKLEPFKDKAFTAYRISIYEAI